jgi:hypothetical protein
MSEEVSMRSVRQSLVTALGLAILVAALGVISGAPVGAAKTNEVQVVNTAAQPVPVSGTVAVSSLPAVTLSGTSPVSFSNTSSTPLFVDSENSSRAGIGAECDAPFDGTGFAQCQLAAVPAGQILVIETITCAASVATGSQVVPIVLNMGGPPIGGGAPISLNHRLPLTRTATAGLDYYGLTTPVRMYAAGGTNVFVFAGVGPSTAGVGDLGCAISGHMAAQ